MICPNCRSEFREGVARCPDCDVELVASLPAAGHPGARADWVEVIDTADVALLPILRSALDGAGIPYVVEGDEGLGLWPLSLHETAFGVKHGLAARFFVPADRAAEAHELLASEARIENVAGESVDEGPAK